MTNSLLLLGLIAIFVGAADVGWYGPLFKSPPLDGWGVVLTIGGIVLIGATFILKVVKGLTQKPKDETG